MNLAPYKIPAICLACGLGGGYVAGRYTTSVKVTERIVTVTKEVEVVKWQDRLVEVQGPVRTTTKTVTVPGPMGPTVTVEKVVEKEKVVIQTVHDGSSNSSTDTSVDKSKVTDARPWIAAEGMAGWAPSNAQFLWGATGQIRVLGPLWLGAGVVKADTWYPTAVLRLEF
jgi:hypothetical protein